jgi:alpha-D-ribose 1-methylphosphonate 5-triphosphate diphosphatase
MTAITNGRIVLKDRVEKGWNLLIRDSEIAALGPASDCPIPDDAQIVDANGGFIAPGFIDIHSDYIEHMAAPRPTSVMDFELSLRLAEREFACHGISTMFHSLSIYKATEFPDKPIRRSENVRQFIGLIDASHSSRHMIRHRFHARFEIDNLDRVAELEEYMRAGSVHLISFMDHTPGQGQYRDIELFRKTLKGYMSASEAEIDSMIARSKAKEKLTMERIAELAALAAEKGIAIASHDDDSPEKVALVRGFGAAISEFPVDMEIARAARKAGMHTLAGAPNVLLGGSHSGNLSAAEAILDGCVDMLCSDYYPGAILHAVFAMNERYGADLARMFRMATLNPAEAVGMGAELGSLEAGKRADLQIIERVDGRFPATTSLFVDGERVLWTRYR